MYIQGESSLQEAFLLFDVAFQHFGCGKAVMQRNFKSAQTAWPFFKT